MLNDSVTEAEAFLGRWRRARYLFHREGLVKDESAADKCNRLQREFKLPRYELDSLYTALRLEERKETRRFLQKRVSKSVSDYIYIYRFEEQRRQLGAPELGSVEELVAKIFDWITEQTQYNGTVRSGPRNAALKSAAEVGEASLDATQI